MYQDQQTSNSKRMQSLMGRGLVLPDVAWWSISLLTYVVQDHVNLIRFFLDHQNQRGVESAGDAASHEKLRRLGTEMISIKMNLSDWKREIMDEIYNGIQQFDHKLVDLELKLVTFDKTIRMIEHTAKVSEKQVFWSLIAASNVKTRPDCEKSNWNTKSTRISSRFGMSWSKSVKFWRKPRISCAFSLIMVSLALFLIQILTLILSIIKVVQQCVVYPVRCWWQPTPMTALNLTFESNKENAFILLCFNLLCYVYLVCVSEALKNSC